MANWFRKSAHIPEISSGIAVEVAPDKNHLFSRFWTRRMVPSTGGQNFHLGSQQLPRNSLSGPLPYNARPFKPLEPAPAYGPRRIVSLNAYGTGMANGQWWRQPLVNDAGEVGKALMPVSNLPFDINGIRPAGKA